MAYEVGYICKIHRYMSFQKCICNPHYIKLLNVILLPVRSTPSRLRYSRPICTVVNEEQLLFVCWHSTKNSELKSTPAATAHSARPPRPEASLDPLQSLEVTGSIFTLVRLVMAQKPLSWIKNKFKTLDTVGT